MARVVVEGGPADGLRVPAAGTFRWLDPERERGFAEAGERRSLYRLDGGRYVWCGPRAGLCGGCGGVVLPPPEVARPGRCPLCGGRVAAVDPGRVPE